jgi:hypothetical protein
MKSSSNLKMHEIELGDGVMHLTYPRKIGMLAVASLSLVATALFVEATDVTGTRSGYCAKEGLHQSATLAQQGRTRHVSVREVRTEALANVRLRGRTEKGPLVVDVSYVRCRRIGS